jgi:hypothetical protein
VEAALLALDVAPSIIPASEYPGSLKRLDQSGLYSWWVDPAGAVELTGGLGSAIQPGRIYAGQAGATAWPSGTPSSATLASRISTQHLGGNIYGSTFRRTLAGCLASALGLKPTGPKRLTRSDEAHLSAWIRDHLSLAVHPYPDRDALEDLELRVLTRLDPPLNLRGMATSEARIALGAVRKRLSSPGTLARPAVSPVEPSEIARTVTPVGPFEIARTNTVPARQKGARVTLHEEIADILRERGAAWMTTQEIADAVNERGRYTKKDGSAMTAFQVHGRTKNYPQLFEREGSLVRLREP